MWDACVPTMIFTNREDAGRRLAQLLGAHRASSPLVLALPRGGVPVAAEVARALDAELDVWVVRKLGVPSRPELAMGAIAEGGGLYVDPTTMRHAQVDHAGFQEVHRRETQELARRVARFRGGRPPPEVEGRTVIVVDDGLATGSTMRAALRAIRERHPTRLVVALPVGASDSLLALRGEADEIVCVTAPDDFRAVGEWYEDFGQTSDDEVLRILAEDRKAR